MAEHRPERATERVAITALAHGGDGLALRQDGSRLYVPFTLPGETVEIEVPGKRIGERTRLVRVVTASPERVSALCRHFGACGGCALQHMQPEAYLAWKRDMVVRAFAQQGIDTDVDPVVALPAGSRRRAVFSALATAKGAILGFHQRAAKAIIAIDECPVLVPAIADRLPLLRGIASAVLRRGREARITVIAADNGLDIAIEGAGRLDGRRYETLAGAAADPAVARISIDGEPILMNRRPEIRAGEALLLPAAGGFLQAAASAEAVMAEAVAAHIGPHIGLSAPVADLFAGIGTFTLRLARHAPVTAVEGDAALLAAISEAANKTPGLKPITPRKRDLFRNPLAPGELDRFAAIVFDPPAAGAKAQAEAIAQSRVPRIAAVSCNPATLARDTRILIDGGYRLIHVAPVDQFLFSAEIEVVATFLR